MFLPPILGQVFANPERQLLAPTPYSNIGSSAPMRLDPGTIPSGLDGAAARGRVSGIINRGTSLRNARNNIVPFNRPRDGGGGSPGVPRSGPGAGGRGRSPTFSDLRSGDRLRAIREVQPYDFRGPSFAPRPPGTTGGASASSPGSLRPLSASEARRLISNPPALQSQPARARSSSPTALLDRPTPPPGGRSPASPTLPPAPGSRPGPPASPRPLPLQNTPSRSPRPRFNLPRLRLQPGPLPLPPVGEALRDLFRRILPQTPPEPPEPEPEIIFEPGPPHIWTGTGRFAVYTYGEWKPFPSRSPRIHQGQRIVYGPIYEVQAVEYIRNPTNWRVGGRARCHGPRTGFNSSTILQPTADPIWVDISGSSASGQSWDASQAGTETEVIQVTPLTPELVPISDPIPWTTDPPAPVPVEVPGDPLPRRQTPISPRPRPEDMPPEIRPTFFPRRTPTPDLQPGRSPTPTPDPGDRPRPGESPHPSPRPVPYPRNPSELDPLSPFYYPRPRFSPPSTPGFSPTPTTIPTPGFPSPPVRFPYLPTLAPLDPNTFQGPYRSPFRIPQIGPDIYLEPILPPWLFQDRPRFRSPTRNGTQTEQPPMSCRFQPDPYTRRILQRVFDLERDVNQLKQLLEEEEPEIYVETTSIHPDAGVWNANPERTGDEAADAPGWRQPPDKISRWVQPQPRIRWLVNAMRGIVEHDDYKHRQVYPKDAILAPPAWWQARRPQIAQAVFLLREVRDDGRLGDSYWSMAIPHYRHDSNFAPSLQFQKGQFQGKLTLNDNSQVLIHCFSIEEAERVIETIKTMIDPEFLTLEDEEPIETYGKRKGQELSDKKVKLVRVAYYPTGQRDTIPEWIKDVT